MQEFCWFVVVSGLGLLVQSMVGFAGSLLAVPLFALLIDPKIAVPAFCLVMIVVDLLLVIEARNHVSIGGVIGVPVGAYALKTLPMHVVGILISVITLVFAILFMAKIRVKMDERKRTQIPLGLLSGVLGGCISESGPPVVIYGLSRGWAKDIFRTTLLTYFTILATEAGITYGVLHMYTPWCFKAAAMALIPSIFAAWVGIKLKNRLGEDHFRRLVLVVIVLVSMVGLFRHAKEALHRATTAANQDQTTAVSGQTQAK